VSTQGLWRESEAFLRRQAATVFENSAASVYVETSAARSCAGEESTCQVASATDFELKLKVTKDQASA